ncbi:hypothetical protein [Negadavirga shengliensis]|uniref:Tetratricopeptide repeat protein n=1 Tax=Negadavirga shengliensis TaxID=1389218 RepID=A0ABV9T707_9BACT
MSKLKSISPDGIPRALEKAERYRLLNEPAEAESICRDILAIQDDHQDALVVFILSLCDQFGTGLGDNEAREAINKLTDKYKQAYYTGIVKEKLAKAIINRGGFGSNFDAYDWIQEAMEAFENAASCRPSGNDEAILRYNACVRTIDRYKLSRRQRESREPFLE